ncbi:alpha/beta hydrolase [Leifsonia aquatica]|uniref:alpha/beta hydrolase n=1 Tax=Leifsonia aquatica TaxID=144185 RepID=UPI0038157875
MRSEYRDWSPVLFEEDPTPGEHEAVQELIYELRSLAEGLHGKRQRMLQAQGMLAAPAWSGIAADAFRDRLLRLAQAAQTAAEQHQAAADASHRWAGALQSTQSAADLALESAVEALEDLERAQALVGTLTADHAALLGMLLTQQHSSPSASPRDQVAAAEATASLRRRAGDIESDLMVARVHLDDAQQRLDDARSRARSAQNEYDTAEELFAREMEATLHGALRDTAEWESVRFTTTFTTLTRLDASPSGSIDLLGTLSPDQFAALLAENPGLMQQFWDNPPDAEAVATWWKKLSPEQREQWCQAVPSIIGNLPGLDADTRIHANMIQLTRDLADPTISPDSPQGIVLRDILKALGVNKFSGPLLDYEKLAKQLTPARGLLSYHLHNDPPLAAVAIGETRAEKDGKVSWMVPGMNSGLGEPGRLNGWANTALNLYDEQNRLELGVAHMVVAWIGYAPPDMSSVLSGDAARKGGARLARELDGQWAASSILGGNPDPYTAVVGHSYGTTVVGNAVSDINHNVQSVVFLASAGIESDIRGVKDLHVDGGGQHVYASESSRDGVAWMGRDFSGRSDPREAQFGGRGFSSEGDPANGLAPTDGHDTLGYGTDNGTIFSPHATAGHGYLNKDTEAIRNTAAASLGHDHNINGGATAPGEGAKRR